MANAENYTTQISELKMVLESASKELQKMADVKTRNQQLMDAML